MTKVHAKLSPCPFCGSRGRDLECDFSYDCVPAPSPVIHCLTCDALGPTLEWTDEGPVETYNKASAIRAWNRRAK